MTSKITTNSTRKFSQTKVTPSVHFSLAGMINKTYFCPSEKAGILCVSHWDSKIILGITKPKENKPRRNICTLHCCFFTDKSIMGCRGMPQRMQ